MERRSRTHLQRAPAKPRCRSELDLLRERQGIDAVETWIENPHLWTRRAALVFTLRWTKEKRDPERMLGLAARLAEGRE